MYHSVGDSNVKPGLCNTSTTAEFRLEVLIDGCDKKYYPELLTLEPRSAIWEGRSKEGVKYLGQIEQQRPSRSKREYRTTRNPKCWDSRLWLKGQETAASAYMNHSALF